MPGTKPPIDPLTGERVEHRWHREGRTLGQDLTLYAQQQLTEILGAVRRARSIVDHERIQQDIADSGEWLVERKAALKAETAHLRTTIRAAAEAREVPILAASSRRIEEIVHEDDGVDRVLSALRTVQDAVIWRLLRYDRHVISVLGMGEQVGRPSQSFETERRAATELFRAGSIAVFADLSNCLRTADILAVDATGQVSMIEVKASGGSSNPAQEERYRQRVEFLNDGAMTMDGVRFEAPRFRPPLKTHLSAFRDLLEKARRAGQAGGLVAPHLLVSVLDARYFAQNGIEADRDALAKVRAAAEGYGRLAPWGKPELYNWDSLDRVRRDERYSVVTTAPFTIYPFGESSCVALALGLVAFRTTLNLRPLRLALRQRSITFDWATPTELLFRSARAEMTAPSIVLEPLLMEAVSLGAFAAVVDGTLRQGRETRAGVQISWAWANESRVWK
jgi:hypothetical protein